MLLNYLERVMSNPYTSGDRFIYDLSEKYPERLIILLEIDYTEHELLDYVMHRGIDDFYPQLFKGALELGRNVWYDTISINKNNNPVQGEMVLDKSTGLLSVYDGSVWLQISN